MFGKNKRGWMRVVEAVAGVMIMAGVLLFFYAQTTEKYDISERIYSLQEKILGNIALNETLRTAIISYDTITEFEGHRAPKIVVEFIKLEIPSNFNFYIRICEVADLTCNMQEYVGKDVYVDERVISSTLIRFDSKKLRLFVWEA